MLHCSSETGCLLSVFMLSIYKYIVRLEVLVLVKNEVKCYSKWGKNRYEVDINHIRLSEIELTLNYIEFNFVF